MILTLAVLSSFELLRFGTNGIGDDGIQAKVFSRQGTCGRNRAEGCPLFSQADLLWSVPPTVLEMRKILGSVP